MVANNLIIMPLGVMNVCQSHISVIRAVLEARYINESVNFHKAHFQKGYSEKINQIFNIYNKKN